MFRFIQDWRNRRIIARSDIAQSRWDDAISHLPLLRGLDSDERARLRDLSILFLHHKYFEGTHGLDVTLEMKLVIALQACLPILNLDWNVYDNWMTVIVYPEGFAPVRVERDEYGVEHHVRSELSGEAWLRGPVILAWDETLESADIDGENLVIHEFAHKLDMQNGDANGYPPLHKDMSREQWTEKLSAAYEDLQRKCDHGFDIGIDCYAASSPAEFFAVMSEVFFERPDVVNHHYPDIYDLFRQYYRQHPLLRLDSQNPD